MSILENIKQAFTGGNTQKTQAPQDAEVKTSSTVTTLASILGAKSATDTRNNPYGALTSWVFFALDKIAQRVSATELELFQYKGNTVERIADHELLSLLETPNHMQSGAEFRYLLAMYLKIHGRAPFIILRAENKQTITGLFPARPDLLTPVMSENGQIVKYEYRVGNKVETFSAEDVVDIRIPNPYDPRKGSSAVLSAYLEIDADANTALWNKYLIENGAQPSGVLQTDRALTDQGFERLKSQWENRYGGAQNAGKVAILEQGLKYQATSVSPKELDYIGTRKFNRESILTLLGVPVGLVLSENVNKANAETAERVFAKETIAPILRLITLAMNAKLVPNFGEDFWVESEEVIPADWEQLRMDSQAGTNSWQTVNETRSNYGLPPLEGGDVLYLPFGLAPAMSQSADNQSKGYIEMRVDTKQKTLTPKEERIKRCIMARTHKKRALVQRLKEVALASANDTDKNEAGKPLRLKVKSQEPVSKILGDDLPPNIKADRLQYLANITKRTEQFRKAMKGYFDDLKVEVIKNVTAKFEKGTLAKEVKVIFSTDDLFEWEKNVKKVQKITHDLYKENIGEGAEAVAGLLGTAPTNYVETPVVQEFLRTKPTKLAELINQTTVDSLLNTLADGVGNGEGLDQLVARIGDVFDIADAVRAETIARTEVGSAQNFGRAIEMQEQGVEKRMWVSAFLNTRDAHAEAHGQVVGVDEPFNVGGEELMYPQDADGSAENVINCQCSVAPVLER